MYILMNSRNQIIQSSSGAVVACDNPPSCRGSDKWSITLRLESGGVDDRYKELMCEYVAALDLAHGNTAELTECTVTVEDVDNCYAYDGIRGRNVPEPERASTPPWVVPLPRKEPSVPACPLTCIVYSWNPYGYYAPRPFNEIAPWRARVRMDASFGRVLSPGEIRRVIIPELDEKSDHFKFPDLSYSLTYEPITQGE